MHEESLSQMANLQSTDNWQRPAMLHIHSRLLNTAQNDVTSNHSWKHHSGNQFDNVLWIHKSPTQAGPRSVQPCVHSKATWQTPEIIDRTSPRLLHSMQPSRTYSANSNKQTYNGTGTPASVDCFSDGQIHNAIRTYYQTNVFRNRWSTICNRQLQCNF